MHINLLFLLYTRVVLYAFIIFNKITHSDVGRLACIKLCAASHYLYYRGRVSNLYHTHNILYLYINWNFNSSSYIITVVLRARGYNSGVVAYPILLLLFGLLSLLNFIRSYDASPLNRWRDWKRVHIIIVVQNTAAVAVSERMTMTIIIICNNNM